MYLPHEQEESPQVGRDEDLGVGMVDDLPRLDWLPGVDGHVEGGAEKHGEIEEAQLFLCNLLITYKAYGYGKLSWDKTLAF